MNYWVNLYIKLNPIQNPMADDRKTKSVGKIFKIKLQLTN